MLTPLIQVGTANAAPYSKDNISSRSKAWLLGIAVSQCFGAIDLQDPNGNALHNTDDGIEEDKAYAGIWFDDVNWGPDEGFHVGEMVEGWVEGKTDDGKINCNNPALITQALDAIGYGNDRNGVIEALCSSGFRSKDSNDCKSARGGFLTSNKKGAERANAWQKAWSKKYLDTGLEIGKAADNGMRYWILWNSFITGCDARSEGVYTDQDISGDKDYKTPWFDGKNIVNHYVTIGEDPSKTVYLGGANLLDSDGKMSCKELEGALDKYAPAFQKALNDDPSLAAVLAEETSGALSSTQTGSSRDGSCEADNGGLAWMGCAVLEVMDGIVGFLDGQIRQLLTVKTTELNNDGGLQKSWAIMRNIAYLILIPMMLLMVIGTALEFGPFDAYTVKKALPRMLAAVVFMSISYYLCIFFINMSNVIGTGILNLVSLSAPGGDVNSLTDVFGGKDGALFTGLSAGGLLVGVAVGAVTWGILGSFALVTIVALLIGYVTLVLRQVLIIMLVVLAPLAILVWIFPGNDKLWKVWRTTMIAMLMMFPLVMLLIASGRFFAGTADTLYGGATGVFIKLIAYIAPYFFIPATFKAGMGAFGVITGAVNDRGRGLFDRQRKYRSDRRQEGAAALKQGFNRTRAGSWLAEGRQHRLARTAAFGSGSIPGTGRYRSELENAEMGHLAAAAAESIKNNPAAAANDDANKIARVAKSRDDFIRQYTAKIPGATHEDAVSQLAFTEQAFGTVMGSKQMQHSTATAALASNSSTDSTAERAQWMRDAVSSGVMTDTQAASLVKQSGSLVSSAGFGELMGAANGTLSDDALLEAASNGFNPANSHRMRKAQAGELAKHLLDRAEAAERQFGQTSPEFGKAVGDASGIRDVMNGMSPDVRDQFAKILQGKPIAGRNMREHEANMEAPEQFGPQTGAKVAYLNSRKTWGTTAAAAGGGVPGGGGGTGSTGGGSSSGNTP